MRDIKDVVYGKMPSIGDVIYIDFGDSVNTGGEWRGKLIQIHGDEWFIEMNGKTHKFNIEEAVHIEVVK